MKNARRWLNCQAQVIPKMASWISVHRTTRPFVASDWSLNSASRSLWKTCSLRISCNLPFKSLTLCTRSSILSLSFDSISLVSPIAKSKCNFTPFSWFANHPELADVCDAQKHNLCSPESPAVNVKRPLEEPFWFTTRWSLSKVSSTVIWIASCGLSTKELEVGLNSSARYWPTTKVSFGSSSKKHFGDS